MGRCRIIRGDGGGGLGDICFVACVTSLIRCTSRFHPVRKPKKRGRGYFNGIETGMIRWNFLSIIMTPRIRSPGFTTIF